MKVSIVVPVYNVERYLATSIDSILISTYRDYELILVDDGSTDDSGAICDQYADCDERVKVIHQPNSGVSQARNVGLNVATGDYVMFVDSDDKIHCKMIEALLNAIESGDYDLSMVHAVKVNEEDFFAIDTSEGDPIAGDCAKVKELSPSEFFSGLCAMHFQYPVIWNKLYKRSLIDGMRFKGVLGEDLEWNNRVSLRLKRAVVVKAEMYYYQMRKGSLMNSGVNRRIIEIIRTDKLCLDDIPQQNREFRDKMLKTLYTMMLLIRRKCVNTEFHAEAEAVCSEVYRDTIHEFKQSNNGWLSKMRSIVGYHFPGPYNFVTRTLETIVVSYYRLRGRRW